MHIVLFGAGGNIGQRIVREALERGHRVTAVVRDPSTYARVDPAVDVLRGDATDPISVGEVAKGADAIVSAISPRTGWADRPASSLTAAAHALIAGAKTADVARLIVVGGAGSLEVEPGVQNVDRPDFPAAYRPEALAQREALAVYREAAGDLAWTYISPAAEVRPGERTGRYRTGADRLLVDADGHSLISYEDYAVGVVDELESGQHPRQRITFAY